MGYQRNGKGLNVVHIVKHKSGNLRQVKFKLKVVGCGLWVVNGPGSTDDRIGNLMVRQAHHKSEELRVGLRSKARGGHLAGNQGKFGFFRDVFLDTHFPNLLSYKNKSD